MTAFHPAKTAHTQSVPRCSVTPISKDEFGPPTQRVTPTTVDVAMPSATAALQTPQGASKALPPRFRNRETLIRTIFGKLERAHDAVTGRDVCIKVSNRQTSAHCESRYGSLLFEDVRHEAAVLAYLQGLQPSVLATQRFGAGRAFVVGFVAEHEDETNHYLITPYLTGGELFKKLETSGRLSEPEARHLFRQIVMGVGFLHENHIAHGDLSIENVCLHDGKAVIIDLGMARCHPASAASKVCPVSLGAVYQRLAVLQRQCGGMGAVAAMKSTQLGLNGWPELFLCDAVPGVADQKGPPCLLIIQPGKPQYRSPELHYGALWDAYANDRYALGVILHMLVTATPPYEQIGDPWFQDLNTPGWRHGGVSLHGHLSLPCRDLIASLLASPAERLSLEAVLAHPWMQP